jgi:hypothetical protein
MSTYSERDAHNENAIKREKNAHNENLRSNNEK